MIHKTLSSATWQSFFTKKSNIHVKAPSLDAAISTSQKPAIDFINNTAGIFSITILFGTNLKTNRAESKPRFHTS